MWDLWCTEHEVPQQALHRRKKVQQTEPQRAKLLLGEPPFLRERKARVNSEGCCVWSVSLWLPPQGERHDSSYQFCASDEPSLLLQEGVRHLRRKLVLGRKTTQVVTLLLWSTYQWWEETPQTLVARTTGPLHQGVLCQANHRECHSVHSRRLQTTKEVHVIRTCPEDPSARATWLRCGWKYSVGRAPVHDWLRPLWEDHQGRLPIWKRCTS